MPHATTPPSPLQLLPSPPPPILFVTPTARAARGERGERSEHRHPTTLFSEAQQHQQRQRCCGAGSGAAGRAAAPLNSTTSDSVDLDPLTRVSAVFTLVVFVVGCVVAAADAFLNRGNRGVSRGPRGTTAAAAATEGQQPLLPQRQPPAAPAPRGPRAYFLDNVKFMMMIHVLLGHFIIASLEYATASLRAPKSVCCTYKLTTHTQL